MSRLLRGFGVGAGLIGVIVLAFSLYAHFLVDYSLEGLESALTAADRQGAASSKTSSQVYSNLVEDLAIQEVLDSHGEVKDLALLELAARSFDEAADRAGSQRAKIYLEETLRSKSTQRHEVLGWIDRIYQFFRSLYMEALKLYQYVKNRFSARPEQTPDMSSYLLLTQAEEKEKKWELEEAAQLYRKFIEFNPAHPERGFVTLALAQVLIKQRNFHEAGRYLRGMAADYAGLEEYRLALNLLKKIDELAARQKKILELEQAIRSQEDAALKDELRLRLATEWIYAYELDKAQDLLRELKDSSNARVRVKAKFFLGWIYKLQAQYDQGASVLLDLTGETIENEDLQLGLDAQLADIYYQSNDREKSLQYYKKISQKESKGEGKEGWEALANTEQAVIYSFDLKDPEMAAAFMRQLEEEWDADALTDLRTAIKEASSVSLRDLAFSKLQQGDIYDAFDLFKKKVKQDPEDAWAHAGLATTYVFMTDLFNAHEHASLAYDYESDEYTASVLAYVMAYQNRFDRAIDLYGQALLKDAEYVPAKYNLAGVLLQTGEFRRGLDLLEELEHDFSGQAGLMTAKIFNNIGYALWHLGEKEKSLGYFRNALEINPSFEEARLNLDLSAQGSGPSALSKA